jgi:hypothetical protein
MATPVQKLLVNTAPKPTVITISAGVASPQLAEAPVGGRVQFQNNDNQGYLIQIENIATLDHYLPAFGTITVFVSEHAQPNTEIDYLLSAVTTPPGSRSHLEYAETAQTAATGGDAPFPGTMRFTVYTAPGGKIIIHP